MLVMDKLYRPKYTGVRLNARVKSSKSSSYATGKKHKLSRWKCERRAALGESLDNVPHFTGPHGSRQNVDCPRDVIAEQVGRYAVGIFNSKRNRSIGSCNK